MDADDVPVPHFGIVLSMDDWQALADKLAFVRWREFIIEPKIRFNGEVGEQATMFFLDPSGNALEFKAFRRLFSDFWKNESNDLLHLLGDICCGVIFVWCTTRRQDRDHDRRLADFHSRRSQNRQQITRNLLAHIMKGQWCRRSDL